MDAEKSDDTRSRDADFAALWSSDGVTRSFAPTASGVPADLPFLFSAGQPFGPYLIVRPIGKGGMGQVYEAEEIDSGRRVAIKILSRGIGDDEERERFLQEGRLAASLSHPNTVYVFGTSEVQGFPVIAMELAPSGTLKDRVVSGPPMTPAQAVDAILQVIDGLEAAGAHGILHRDVKPSNCFVAADRRVLVGDFGLSIATLARLDGSGEAPGTILGTPGFASPEQLRGNALDVRSDIYSVGATIYYLLTGKAPFDDSNVATMITRVTTEPPPLLALSRPDVPSRFASVVTKCLAKKPSERYANYAALRSALEPFRSASVTPAPLSRRFIAGAIDSYAATLPVIPINMYLGAKVLDTSDPNTIILVTLPTILVAVTYYTLLEGWFGCGAGKALFNLRVVDSNETAPGLRRALMRALVYILPPEVVRLTMGYLVVPLAKPGVTMNNTTQLLLAAFAIGVSVLVFALQFSTVRRRNGWAALHDLASVTRVVVRPRSMATRKSTMRAAKVVPTGLASGERVGPYMAPPGTRAAAVAAGSAFVVEGFDDRLRRSVWVELLPPGTPSLPAWRRDLGRPGRTRWLSGRREGPDCWDAYEAIDGQPLVAEAHEPQPWTRVRHWTADIASEIAAGAADGSPPVLATDRLWLGSDDRVRLLEWPCPRSGRPVERDAGSDRGSPIEARSSDAGGTAYLAAAQRFLYGIATGALRGIDAQAAALHPPDVPLPLSARAFLMTLGNGSFGTADALSCAASDLLRSPAVFSRSRRVAPIAICAFIPIVMPIAVVGGLRVQTALQTTNPRAFQFQTCLNQLAAYERKGERNLTGAQKETRDAIEVFIAEHLQEETKEAAAIARTFPVVSSGNKNSYLLAERAIARHPTRTPEEIRRADVAVARLAANSSRGLALLRSPTAQWALAAYITAWSCAVVAILSLVGALVTRSGFTLRGAGAALVTGRGEVASRMRALWRAIVTWLPVVPALVLIRFSPRIQESTVPWALVQTLPLALLVVATVWALKEPSCGLQDRIAGTRIVPR